RHEAGRRELARPDRFAARSGNRRIHHGAGALLPPGRRRRGANENPAAGAEALRLNIIERTDEEIRAMADPLWRDLLKYSNEGKYGEFAKRFAKSLALAMNQVVVNHQFANSELARNLSGDFDFLGVIRRGEHVTVLYRQRSTR